jgi:hypothetical protein
LAWLAEDHPMPPATEWVSLTRALVELEVSGDAGDRALRRAVRETAGSGVDTSRVLFDPDNLPRPAEYEQAIEELLKRTDDRSFSGLTARGVLRAHYANHLCIAALCLAAGVSPADAQSWFGVSDNNWKQDQVEQLLEYLNDLVSGKIESPVKLSIAARGIEYIPRAGGWAVADGLRTDGVPYGMFLAQRAGGGVWLNHKNETSRFPNIVAAQLLCDALESSDIDYRRSSTVGGTSKPSDLQRLTGIRNKRVGVAVLQAGKAVLAVAFSSARDGGTARANGDGLLQMQLSGLPLALVLTGPGWADRWETDRLARRFQGLVFTEETLARLLGFVKAELL